MYLPSPPAASSPPSCVEVLRTFSLWALPSRSNSVSVSSSFVAPMSVLLCASPELPYSKVDDDVGPLADRALVNVFTAASFSSLPETTTFTSSPSSSSSPVGFRFRR